MKRGFYVHQVLDVNSGCSVAPIRRRWGDGRVTSAAGRGTRRNSRGNRRRRRALSPTESGRPVAARPRKRPSWAARTDINGVLFFLFLGFYCPNKDGRGFFFTFSTSGRRATRRAGGGGNFYCSFFLSRVFFGKASNCERLSTDVDDFHRLCQTERYWVLRSI